MPLVLVENERTAGGRFDHWADVTGVSYQFPNQYRNKVLPGETFVYYRGARRSGGKRGTPEYFGVGRIGEVREDPSNESDQPKAKRRWYCEIKDYQPFAKPVPFKVDGEFIEKIPDNFWGVAVRDLPVSTLERIIQLAGLEAIVDDGLEPIVAPTMPPIEAVVATTLPSTESLLIRRPPKTEGRIEPGPTGSGSNRRSRHAVLIGRRAEEVVLGLLHVERRTRVRWVAAEGETPGWDIEYWEGEQRIAVEVKGTSGKGFPSIELTAGELSAARALGASYWLYLVADCLGTNPVVQRLNDPALLLAQGTLQAAPILYRITPV